MTAVIPLAEPLFPDACWRSPGRSWRAPLLDQGSAPVRSRRRLPLARARQMLLPPSVALGVRSVSTYSAHGHNVLCERFVAEAWMLATSVPIGGIVILRFPSQQGPLPSMAVDGLIVVINLLRASWTIPPPNKEYPRQ